MNSLETEAIVITKKGAAKDVLQRRRITISEPKANEVVIESEAFGLNYADVMARRGLYREAPPFPCVVGYEVVGKIIVCGSSVSQSLLGKRVLAFCRFGGYAKKVVTQDYAVIEINDIPSEKALAMCTQAVTAYYMAEYITQIHPGDKVLIHAAAGGVGTILIQLAKRRGAEIVAKIGNDEKRELVLNLGADHVINYKTSDYSDQLQNMLQGSRLDISFNPFAGSTFKKDMELIGSGGRVILFGGSELSSGKWGILSQLNFVRKMGIIIPIGLMMRSKNVFGVNMLKIADNRPDILEKCFKEVVQLFILGELKTQVGGVYSVDQIAEAHAALENGNTTGKLTVKW